MSDISRPLSPRSRRGTRAMMIRVLSVALVTLGVLTGAPPASAHDELVSSTPAAEGSVSVATDRLVMVFSDDLVVGSTDVVVHDPSGKDVTIGETDTSSSTLATTLDVVAPGRHTVDYRVVGADGHVLQGSFWFTVVAAGHPLPAAATVPPASALGAVGSTRQEAPDWALWLIPGAIVTLGVLMALGYRRYGRTA